MRLPCEAVLLGYTVVRVNPQRQPFRLAVARNGDGAQTLCLVDDGVVGTIGEAVELYAAEDIIRARER